jgi:hypothetical protein
MATSTCPKCDSTTFEAKEYSPRGSNFKYQFIQCASCGAVVGVMDYFNIGGMLQTLAEKLRVGSIE